MIKVLFLHLAFTLALCLGAPALRGEQEQVGDGQLMFAPLVDKNEQRELPGYYHGHDDYDCDGDWGWLYTHNKDTGKYVYWKATKYYVKGFGSEEDDDDAFYWKHCDDGKLINKAYPGYALSWTGHYGWLKLVHYSYGVAWTYDSHDYQFKTHYHYHYYCVDLYRDSGGWYHTEYCYDDWKDQEHYWEWP